MRNKAEWRPCTDSSKSNVAFVKLRLRQNDKGDSRDVRKIEIQFNCVSEVLHNIHIPLRNYFIMS